MRSLTVTLILIPILAVIIAIPVLIGVYVYRDAKARDMNPALWTVIALFVPSFMGLIAYLIVRGNYSALVCPSCQSSVENNFTVCPKCGTKLRDTCPSCGYPTEPGWQACPQCASSLNLSGQGVYPPVRRRDTGLTKVLGVIVTIPILFIIFVLLFSVSGYTTDFDGAMNTFMVESEAYLSDKNDERITAWYENCPYSYDRVYALKYETLRNESKATHYIIYLPFADEDTIFETERGSGGLFGKPAVELHLEGSGIGTGGYIFGISTYGDHYAELEVYYNGSKLETEITEIDFHPMLFEVVGEEVE